MTSRQTTVNVIAGAVLLILLIACVNVAGLLLARGATRQAELAVRASLGAGRGRIVRQLLTESLVLACAGGALGIFLAWLSLDAIVANIPMSLPANSPATLNPTVLLLTVALLVPTALLFGFAPAIRLSRVRIGPALGHGGRLSSASLSKRGSRVLIGLEVALALVLVAGAGLMLRSFSKLSAVDLGFQTTGVLTMEVLPLDDNLATHKAYYPELLRRLRGVAGVESAGLVDNFPLGGGTSYTSMQGSGDPMQVTVFSILPGYFETIGATLRDGRLLTEADHASGFRGVVINESAARELFKDGPAVNRPVVRAAGSDRTPWTVIGVVGDLRHGGPLDERNLGVPQIYLPFEPDDGDLRQAMMLVLRTSGSAPDLADRLRRTAQSVGPRVLIEGIRSADDWFGDRVITPRRRTVLLTLLGSLGLILAIVGVFGMTAYAVARRTQEIGLRMVFGARPGQVVGRMLGDMAVPIVVGTVVGLGAAALSTRAIQSFLFETDPLDPGTFAAVALVLVVTGVLAAWIPARRAARVDPIAALRTE